MRVRIPDIPLPHRPSWPDSVDRWQRVRGTWLEVGAPLRRSLLVDRGYIPQEDCDSEYFWPVIDDEHQHRRSRHAPPGARFWTCCHEIEVD